MRTSRRSLSCRMIKRCVCFLLAITFLPSALIYLILSNDHIYRSKSHIVLNGTHHFIGKEEIPIYLSKSQTEKVEKRIQNRNERLGQKCAEHGLDIYGNDSLHKPNPWEFLVNKNHKIIWCNVFKVASTSWMYNFNLLAGYSPEFLKKTSNVPLELARKKYPRVTLDQLDLAMNSSITFLIVRHPFERLLSAYRDKLIFALPHSFHDKLGHKIIKKYRKKVSLSKRIRDPKWPTFSEFVQYLIDQHKNKIKFDMHWQPIVEFCTPCQIKFDIIAKFETLDEDQRYIIERAKLQSIIGPQWKNSGKGKKTQSLVTKFFSQLNSEELEGLYQIYKYDFELFNYESEVYFNMIEKESTHSIKDENLNI